MALPDSLSDRGARDLTRLRAVLGGLEGLALAALLRELGAVLYNREIRQWRALTDISDELIDQATVGAKVRLLDRALRRPPAKAAARGGQGR